MSRLEAVKALVEQAPNDSRVRFMLAMEYLSTQHIEDALASLQELLRRDPDYVAAHFQAGRACESLGQIDEARAHYEHGVVAAQKAGDGHALGEIQAALDLLG